MSKKPTEEVLDTPTEVTTTPEVQGTTLYAMPTLGKVVEASTAEEAVAKATA